VVAKAEGSCRQPPIGRREADLDILVLKMVLTPTVVAIASLAGRRWGPAVSGWFIALPFTSGPVAVFLAIAHGNAFAATAALGILAGTISPAVFCLVYSLLAPSGWLYSFLVACGAIAVATIILQHILLPAVAFALLVAAVLGVALRLLPATEAPVSLAGPPPAWDLPVRMVVATTLVLLLTGLAPVLGARLTGLLAPFPLFASILAIFAHQQQGPAAARRVLRGLLLGLFAFDGFFLVFSSLVVRDGSGLSFLAALAAALLIQACSFQVLRRAG
jgi:hypothetical protein